MDTLYHLLLQLGLTEYLSLLIGNGFNTWTTITIIDEHEFDRLGVRLGHRRLLQRHIADLCGYPRDLPLPCSTW